MNVEENGRRGQGAGMTIEMTDIWPGRTGDPYPPLPALLGHANGPAPAPPHPATNATIPAVTATAAVRLIGRPYIG